MELNIEELRKRVATLTDQALLEVNPDDLVDSARAVYEAELASRGLAWSKAPEVDESGPLPLSKEDLVSLGKFETVDEARFVRTMLENEGIPALFVGELTPGKAGGDPLAGLELMTPASFFEQAQLVLNTEISEEELARQAEAAGGPVDG